jgi:hypothetical protein
MLSSLLCVLALSQTPDAAKAPPKDAAAEAAPLTTEEKTAKAMERLSIAAEKLAAAAERLSPPPEVVVTSPAQTSHWDFYANAGLTWTAGNVSSLSFVASGGGKRVGDKTITQFKLFGGYGQTFNPAVPPAMVGTTDVLIYNMGATAQFDYRFTKLISAFIGAGIDADHVKSVELRGYGEAGLGVLWVDEKVEKWQKWFLKTDVSFRVQPESRFQYYPTPAQLPDALLVGPRAALQFHYGMSAGTYFDEALEVIANVVGDDAGRILLNSVSKLAVGIATHVSVAALLTFKYDSKPAPGAAGAPAKQPLDTILTLALEANF